MTPKTSEVTSPEWTAVDPVQLDAVVGGTDGKAGSKCGSGVYLGAAIGNGVGREIGSSEFHRYVKSRNRNGVNAWMLETPFRTWAGTLGTVAGAVIGHMADQACDKYVVGRRS